MDAATKLAVAKERCEQSLLFFTRYNFKARYGFKFIINRHHEEITEFLEAVYRGEIQNGIINMPPGSGKTELNVINFAAWGLALDPWSRFLHLSYSDELATLNSATTRNLIRDEAFQQHWPLVAATDSNAKSRWNIMDGERVAGGMYATSTDGQVTGFRAGRIGSTGFKGAILIDDPLKPKDANSEKMRNDVNQQLAQTVRSRRAEPTTPILCIMQRLHEKDPTGFLLEEGIGEKFELLKVRALDDEGKSYWEIKEPTEQLLAFKAKQPYVFSGQYQQEPTPDEGIYFTKDMFEFYDELPKHVHKYGASDYAVSEGKNDFTVHGVLAIDHEGNPYLPDLWRKQAKPDVSVSAHLDMVIKHQPIAWIDEKGVIAKSLGPFIATQMHDRKAYVARVQYASTTDKATRARAYQAWIATKKLRLPRNAPWVADFINEHLRFPLGPNDDQVDIGSLFGRALAGLTPGHLPVERSDEIRPEQLTQSHIERLAKRNLARQST